MITAACIVLPVIPALCLFIKKKALSCFICGVSLFVFFMAAAGADTVTELYDIYRLLPLYPVSMLSHFPAPVGFLFPAKLLSMLFPEPFTVTVCFAAVFAFGTAGYIYRNCEFPSAAALLAAAGGFMIFAASDPCTFTAAVISAFSFRYASQRRFLRFAALVLLAACFRFDALLLLPLYLIFLIPVGLPLMLAAAAVCGSALFLGVYQAPFDLIYGQPYNTLLPGLSPVIPAVLAALCLWAGIMNRMLICGKQTRAYMDTMLVLLFASAFLSLICVYDIRYLPLMLMCAFPSVPAVGGSLLKTTESLITLTFREKKKPVIIGTAVFGALALGAWYWYILTDGGAFITSLREAGGI